MDLSSFQDRDAVQRAAKLLLRKAPRRQLTFLHVCGTHENTIARYGLRSLLPDSVRIVAGPGCPVCVTSTCEIDSMIEIAQDHARVFTYGDMFSVPGSGRSLRDARADGADVQVVYSLADAISIARKSPKPSAFFSIGFETTAPLAATTVLAGVPPDFYFQISHRLIPPAMRALLDAGEIRIDGLLCPGHVSTIIGAEPYEPFAREYGIPIAIAGFEPLDVMLALIDLVDQVNSGKPRVFNEYSRAVRWTGNRKAQGMIERVFETCDSEWRGLGTLPESGLRLRDEYRDLDVRNRFDLKPREPAPMPPGCRCADVLLGSADPSDCPLFGDRCTPPTPVGPCMVSSEGTCRIWYTYGGRGRG